MLDPKWENSPVTVKNLPENQETKAPLKIGYVKPGRRFESSYCLESPFSGVNMFSWRVGSSQQILKQNDILKQINLQQQQHGKLEILIFLWYQETSRCSIAR